MKSSNAAKPNVIARLRMRIRQAKALGFEVRQEALHGDGNWCEIGGRRFIFLDQHQSAVEQILVLEQSIASYFESVRSRSA